MAAYALHSQRVLIGKTMMDATVYVEGEKIIELSMGSVQKPGFEFRDFGSSVIMPGLIDSHVHINEPGRTEWEGFDTATKAAAAGGICTLVDMPLNSTPVTINLASFKEKLKAAKKCLHVNCGFWGGYKGQDLSDLDELMSSGILGVKVFLVHSGIDDFPSVSESDLRQAMPVLQKHDALILAHCELIQAGNQHIKLKKNPKSYQAYLDSRPKKWEDEAIKLMISLCKEYGVKTHIVHLSSSDSLSQIQDAKCSGHRLTVETCPHYLYFDAENITDGSVLHKCAPPIREAVNNLKLWQALKDGLLDFVVTDHSPAPPEMKSLAEGNFETSWGGISGLQFSLPVVWTKASTKGFGVEDVCNWMSYNVAKLLNIKTKGKLEEGFDADIVIWNPEDEFVVEEEKIFHRHKMTPYKGEKLKGVVTHTLINGEFVYENQQITNLNRGKVILKEIR